MGCRAQAPGSPGCCPGTPEEEEQAACLSGATVARLTSPPCLLEPPCWTTGFSFLNLKQKITSLKHKKAHLPENLFHHPFSPPASSRWPRLTALLDLPRMTTSLAPHLEAKATLGLAGPPCEMRRLGGEASIVRVARRRTMRQSWSLSTRVARSRAVQPVRAAMVGSAPPWGTESIRWSG